VTHIFISYSRKDSEYVRHLAYALEREGLSVWLDERIDYGTKWPRVLEEKIDKCGAFIVVMSPNAKDSEWVQKELARALHKKKEIFPLLLEGDQWLEVQTLQHVDVREGLLPPQDFYKRLARVIGKSSPFDKTVAGTPASHSRDLVKTSFVFLGDRTVVPGGIEEIHIEVFLDNQLLGSGDYMLGFDLSTTSSAGSHKFEMRYQNPLIVPVRPLGSNNPDEEHQSLSSKRSIPVFSNIPIDIVLPASHACEVFITYNQTLRVFVVSSITAKNH
jgi:hypothetical protein